MESNKPVYRNLKTFAPNSVRSVLYTSLSSSLKVVEVPLKVSLQLPPSQTKEEWIVALILASDVFTNARMCAELVDNCNCDKMSVGQNVEFHWEDGGIKYKQPVSLPARQYMKELFEFAATIIENNVFEYASQAECLNNAKKVWRRLARVYFHVFTKHMDSIRNMRDMLFRNFAALYVFSQMFGLVEPVNFTYLFDCLANLPELKALLDKEWGPTKVTSAQYSASVMIKKPVQTDTLDYDLFLSHYQATGQQLAGWLCSLLQERNPNYRVFLDINDLKEIHNLEENIKNSHNVLLLLTEGVLTRPFVQLEIKTAVENKKNIILLWDKEKCHWPKADVEKIQDPNLRAQIEKVLTTKAIIWNAEKAYREVTLNLIEAAMVGVDWKRSEKAVRYIKDNN